MIILSLPVKGLLAGHVLSPVTLFPHSRKLSEAMCHYFYYLLSQHNEIFIRPLPDFMGRIPEFLPFSRSNDAIDNLSKR